MDTLNVYLRLQVTRQDPDGNLNFNLYRLNGPNELLDRTTHLAPQFASLDFQEHKE